MRYLVQNYGGISQRVMLHLRIRSGHLVVAPFPKLPSNHSLYHMSIMYLMYGSQQSSLSTIVGDTLMESCNL